MVNNFRNKSEVDVISEVKEGQFDLAETLGPVERLSLVYAPARSRPFWLGYLALESRLERAARPGGEPMLAQIKLAWWRDRFAEPASLWPAGEPLLAALTPWDEERAALTGLVDGWEAMTIHEDEGVQLRAARVEALLALLRLTGAPDRGEDVRLATLEWIDRERRGEAWGRLSKAMRPLAVLRAVALRDAIASDEGKLSGPIAMLTAMRAGLFGR